MHVTMEIWPMDGGSQFGKSSPLLDPTSCVGVQCDLSRMSDTWGRLPCCSSDHM